MGPNPSASPLGSPLGYLVMGEERFKHTPDYMARMRTFLAGGRKQYKDDKLLKLLIITKCMNTFFSASSYNSVTRRRMGRKNDRVMDLDLLDSL